MEEGEGHSLQGDREAACIHPDPVQEHAAAGEDHGLPAGGRGRHAARAAAMAQREPAARRSAAEGAEVGPWGVVVGRVGDGRGGLQAAAAQGKPRRAPPSALSPVPSMGRMDGCPSSAAVLCACAIPAAL